ncbi:helix-turn-helix transcriptional regulator [Hoeflea sp.]|uniref:helix-turn-helix transcriptional regulator n=1 Tax=Hoeflea sp. TaxID=1940281 RepID=UPI003A947358
MEVANDNSFQDGDLLLGAPAIARFLGLNSRQVYRLVYGDVIPVFKLGGSVSARRSSLRKWLADQEAAA